VCPCNRILQLLRELGGFRFSRWERMHEFRQFFLRDARLELNACQPRSAQQLRKLFFGWRSFERHAIQ
jgi:hypothetical protein